MQPSSVAAPFLAVALGHRSACLDGLDQPIRMSRCGSTSHALPIAPDSKLDDPVVHRSATTAVWDFFIGHQSILWLTFGALAAIPGAGRAEVVAAVATLLIGVLVVVFCLAETKAPHQHFVATGEVRAEQRRVRLLREMKIEKASPPAGSRSGDSTMTSFNLELDEAYERARAAADAKVSH